MSNLLSSPQTPGGTAVSCCAASLPLPLCPSSLRPFPVRASLTSLKKKRDEKHSTYLQQLLEARTLWSLTTTKVLIEIFLQHNFLKKLRICDFRKRPYGQQARAARCDGKPWETALSMRHSSSFWTLPPRAASFKSEMQGQCASAILRYLFGPINLIGKSFATSRRGGVPRAHRCASRGPMN